MDKKTKRERIKEVIDLSGNRFKEAEYDELLDLVNNAKDFIDSPKSYEKSSKGFSSDGKYTRKEKTTYRLRDVDGRIVGEEQHEYFDDDGTSGNFTYVFDAARDILNIARIIKNDNTGYTAAESRRALDRSLTDRAKRIHEERNANRHCDHEEPDTEKRDADHEAIVETAKVLYLGVTKYLPKVARIVRENGIPLAREVGSMIKNRKK
ncbi:MAG: hypothetical protein IJJ01_11640 [Firmicutes bacterium]|nr:hypothetical protein [Bacillota bacterium]